VDGEGAEDDGTQLIEGEDDIVVGSDDGLVEGTDDGATVGSGVCNVTDI